MSGPMVEWPDWRGPTAEDMRRLGRRWEPTVDIQAKHRESLEGYCDGPHSQVTPFDDCEDVGAEDGE